MKINLDIKLRTQLLNVLRTVVKLLKNILDLMDLIVYLTVVVIMNLSINKICFIVNYNVMKMNTLQNLKTKLLNNVSMKIKHAHFMMVFHISKMKKTEYVESIIVLMKIGIINKNID